MQAQMKELIAKGLTATGRIPSEPQIQTLSPAPSLEFLRIKDAFMSRNFITDYPKNETRVRASSR